MKSTSRASRLVRIAARSPALRQHRPRGHAEVHPELARHDLRQRGLAEARRPVEQRVVHRLAAPPGALDEDREVRPRRLLADELGERLRPQRPVGVLGQRLGPQRGIGTGHRRYPFGASARSAARISPAASSASTPAIAAAASPAP